MPSERTAWEPPTELDGFRIVGLLGAGAMGRVYLAHDTFLERDVALKFIGAERPETRAIERFLIEARAIARLQHPNVVSIYRIGEVEGRPYLAYEFVRGTTLGDLRRPVAWREVLEIGIGLARGLAAAHSRGILHRDIKPANIMLSDGGEVKLVDFGIAKLVAHEPGAGRPTLPASPSLTRPKIRQAREAGEDRETRGRAELLAAETDTGSFLVTPHESPGSELTEAGVVIGTPRYLAPERWTGEPATPRSEVFSLGLVLYELLTGTTGDAIAPRTGGPIPAVAPSLAPVRSLAPAVPADVAEVIDRAVMIDPNGRWRTPDEVRDALERASERLAQGKPAPLARGATRYTRNGDVSLAYQVFGSGPTDLVIVPGFVSHLDLSWEEPSFVAWLARFGRRHRVIMFDKRGTGLSDRVEVSSLGDRVDDVRAVMDAAGSERAIIFGQSEGGSLSALFAALYPERTRALILYATTARALVGHDYPWGLEPSLFEWAYGEIQAKWGTAVFMEQEAPSKVGDAAFADWWARYLKMGASPGAAIALLKANAHIDIRHILPGIRVPTLVMHRDQDPLSPPGNGEYFAEHVPGGRFVLLHGADHLPFIGDTEGFHRAIEAFLDEDHVAPTGVPLIATVLVANPIGRHWDDLDKATREGFKRLFIESMARFGGSELDTSRYAQLVLSFRTPMAALACAEALVSGAAALGAPGAAALHLDVLTGGDQAPGREVIDRVAALAWNAEPGQILATRIVRDLATRSTLRFRAIAAGGADGSGGGDPLATDAIFTVQTAPKAEAPRRPEAPTGPSAMTGHKVRLAVAQGFGKLLAPYLGKLRKDAPDLRVEVLTSNAYVDVRRDADMALRVGPFAEPGLRITPVGEVGWALYGSEAYLARHAPPMDATALAGHDLVGFSESLSRSPGARWFDKYGADAHLVLECNDGVDIVDAVRAGLGISILPCLIGGMEADLVRLSATPIERRDLLLVQPEERADDAGHARVIAFLRDVLDQNRHLLVGDGGTRPR